jgi:hypothetical protein
VFSLENALFDYEPYPICYSTDVFAPGDYEALVSSYPDISLFAHMPKLGDKYSLSERNNASNYHAFIKANPAWSRIHGYLKSEKFIDDTLAFLRRKNIDLDLGDFAFVSGARKKRRGLMSRLAGRTEIGARFEFSAMGGQGGHIRPHTDEQRKIITLVLSMSRPQEWSEAWGGGTQVCLPKDRSRIYNWANRYMEFEEVDVQKSFPFTPNQCILFIKTYNSWHQVAPINAPVGAPLRKTLTVNIERMA